MSSARPSTPPPKNGGDNSTGAIPRPPPTPEQIRRMEVSRLKAKARRQQRDAEAAKAADASSGQKRPYAAISTANVPTTQRDATKNKAGAPLPKDAIQPARKFAKYIEYDFSKMTDTKGGFLTLEDDPHNKALHVPTADDKPEGMTLKEWERLQLLKKLQESKSGKFEPVPSVLTDEKQNPKTCFECGAIDIDWRWEEIFKCRVCNKCKEKKPEKYSLLTKSEAKEDYLLTDPELKDEEILPHMERPNPHNTTWNNMMLFLRYQVEEYAFSPKKWGSPEKLDEAFAKREEDKKKRKEDKFNAKLRELRKKTRVDAWRRSQAKGGGDGQFGDLIRDGKHEHEWGATTTDPVSGTTSKQCVECGMEVEELEF